jgi:hypothetical protein
MITINHAEIKDWVEKHYGKPEIINENEAGSNNIGIRINLPGKEDERFLGEKQINQHIGWKKFFTLFEKQNLAFEYTDNENFIDTSMNYRFIKRDKITS